MVGVSGRQARARERDTPHGRERNNAVRERERADRKYTTPKVVFTFFWLDLGNVRPVCESFRPLLLVIPKGPCFSGKLCAFVFPTPRPPPFRSRCYGASALDGDRSFRRGNRRRVKSMSGTFVSTGSSPAGMGGVWWRVS